jgi:hypothetical protein
MDTINFDNQPVTVVESVDEPEKLAVMSFPPELFSKFPPSVKRDCIARLTRKNLQDDLHSEEALEIIRKVNDSYQRKKERASVNAKKKREESKRSTVNEVPPEVDNVAPVDTEIVEVPLVDIKPDESPPPVETPPVEYVAPLEALQTPVAPVKIKPNKPKKSETLLFAQSKSKLFRDSP